jgi:chromosome segregation ATPase
LLEFDELSGQLAEFEVTRLENEKITDRLRMDLHSYSNRLEFLKDKESEVSALQEKLSKLDGKCKTLVFESESQNSQLEDLKADVDYWKDRSSSAEKLAANNNQDAAVATLHAELESLYEQLSQKSREKDSFKSKITDLQAKIDTIEDLNRTIELQRAENDKLSRTLTSNLKEIESLRSKLTVHDSLALKNTDLNSQISDLTHDLKSLTSTSKDLHTDLTSQKSKNSLLTQKLKLLKTLQSEIDTLQAQLLTHDRTISGLTSQNEQLAYLLRQKTEKDKNSENFHDFVQELENEKRVLTQSKENLMGIIGQRDKEIEELKVKGWDDERKGILVDELRERVRILGEDLGKYEKLLERRDGELEGVRGALGEMEGVRGELGEEREEKGRIWDDLVFTREELDE